MSDDETQDESTDETARPALADEKAPLPSEQEVDEKAVLDGHDVESELLEDWRFMFDALHARFATGDFATGLDLVAGIGAEAEKVDHHPDVDLRYPHVDVKLTSHDVGGVTSRDVALAREISRHAGRLGASASPHEVAVLELALDTADVEAVKGFWAALLGYQGSEDDEFELSDPDGRGPTLWFQQTEAHDEPRQRFHLDLRVPPESAKQRISRAVEAGGSVVDDSRAPAFTVLADAEGNRACVTTWLGRS